MQYKLLTSNENKLKEFKRFGLKDIGIEKGKDIKEVKSDFALVVAAYKARDAGAGIIVEDTSLLIDSVDPSIFGTNIRWNVEGLEKYDGYSATWQVVITKNTGTHIYAYVGTIQGTITTQSPAPDAFGFDAFFIPENAKNTLYELEQMGVKDVFSARRFAVEKLLEDNPDDLWLLDTIGDWKGDYQS